MDIVLSVLMLLAFALIVGAFFQWRRGGRTKQAMLMVVLAMVAIVNVLIWTLPDEDGQSPLQRVDTLGQ